MPRPDPLKVLEKLRRLEVAEARRLLAERHRVLAAAEARREAAEMAPAREAGSAPPADYAAWLPLALAERERAARAERHSANLAELAREALTVTRLAERQLELLREARAKAQARQAQRKAQAALDEFAGRR